MKKLLLSIFAIISLNTYAQDCSILDVHYDEFDKDTTWYLYTLDHHEKYRDISAQMFNHKGRKEILLTLQTTSNTLTVEGKGAKILLENNEMIELPYEIDVEASNGTYLYNLTWWLTSEELDILSSVKIKKFRLYIFDEEVISVDADRIKKGLACLKSLR